MLLSELATKTFPPLKVMPLGPSPKSPHCNTKLHAAETALLDQENAPMIAQLKTSRERFFTDQAFVRDPLRGEEGVSVLM